MIVLSGGNNGGLEVEWVATGKMKDGREYMSIDGLVYAPSNSGQPTFQGTLTALAEQGLI